MVAGMFINMKRTDSDLHKVLSERSVDGKICITIPELAEAIGMSKRTINYALNHLEDSEKIKRLGGRGRGGMIYEVKQ